VTGALTRRTVVASALLALIVGAAFAILLVSNGRERHSTQLAQHSQRVLASADRLQRLVLDVEASQRGFSLTRNRAAFTRWDGARRAIPGASAALVRMTAVPAHHGAALDVARATDAYLRGFSVPLVRRAQRSVAAARRAVPTDTMRRAEADLAGRFGRFSSTEQRFVAAREQRARSDVQTAKTAAIVGLAASVVLIVLFGAYVARAIVAPARRSLEASNDELRQLADEQAALRRVATLVAQGAPSDQLLSSVVREVDHVLGASSTRLARYDGGEVTVVISSGADDQIPVGAAWPIDGDHIAGRVYRTGRTARRDSSDGVTGYLGSELRKMGVRAAIGAPIVVDGHLWGTMVPYWIDHDPPPDIEQRLSQFTDLIATAIANTASRSELTASRARVVASADEARRRIERDLHDGAQQRLVHTVITLKMARRAIGEDGGTATPLVDEALEQAEGATAALRELVHGILPASLDRGGLRAGINTLVARAPIPVSIAVTEERLPPAVEATGYFVVAEALTNVIKHADAGQAWVRAELGDGVLTLEVRDDGRGGASLDGSSGLVGLQDRLAALNGELELTSPAGGGTVVAATIPVPAR
jgi:signal transduction histidine kinase